MILRRVRRFIRMTRDKAFVGDRGHGFVRDAKWRVRYSTGEHTWPCTYGVAKDYATIFGGSVEWLREKQYAAKESHDRDTA